MKLYHKTNKGFKYLLAIIDIFSKYGWLIPLKNKDGKSVKEAFIQIFKTRKPEKLWTDKGTEFYNKDFKELLKSENIELYSTENEEKSSVVERWNRTMKEKMFKYFTEYSTSKYIDILDDLVNKYNNTKHTSTKFTPLEGSKKQNERQIYINLYADLEPMQKPKFKVGDMVRITKKKTTFEKGYTTRWTEEIFKINHILTTQPPTYKLIDMKNEEIQGSFYEQELQKTNQQMFRVEKILSSRKKNNKDEVLVKWRGYDKSFNSWINRSEIIR